MRAHSAYAVTCRSPFLASGVPSLPSQDDRETEGLTVDKQQLLRFDRVSGFTPVVDEAEGVQLPTELLASPWTVGGGGHGE
jgi:hypothetical protein